MAWLEVETKVRIHDVDDFRKRLLKIANFKKKSQKGDDYFAIKHWRGMKYPKKAFRIRNIGDEHTINFKKHLKHLWDKQVVVKREYEFKIKTEYLENFLALLQDLGFEEWVKKRKTSEIYIYKKNKKVDIYINYIEHLGYFIEMEYLAKDTEVEKAKKILHKVLND
jgi:predicted adenylyl cyclase CyaB